MIKLIVFDIDGVITDGTYIIDNNGNEYKRINFKDLDSFTLIKKLNIPTLFLTGENNELTKYFNKKFKPNYFKDGVNNKYEYLKEFCNKINVCFENVCYIGDGKKDFEVMQKVGISIAPQNAIDEIKKIATYKLNINGGDGILYETYKIILTENNKLFNKNKNKIISNVSFNQILNTHIEISKLIMENKELINSINNAINMMISSIKNKGIIYTCGNGGSAADAQHLTAELISKFNYDRRALPSIALTTNASIITSIGNDYNYNMIFARQIEGLCKKNDILFAITTSGNSQNIIFALETAKTKKIKSILLTSNKCHLYSNKDVIVIKVPSNNTPRIQEFHILIIHYICEEIEKYFMEVKNEK